MRVKCHDLCGLACALKTFSAHVRFIFRFVVSGKRFSTHEESRDMVAMMRLCVFSLDEKISQFNIGDIDLYPIFVKK